MNCPNCGDKTSVVNIRHIKLVGLKNPTPRRQRKCKTCAYDFKTYEFVGETNTSLQLPHE